MDVSSDDRCNAVRLHDPSESLDAFHDAVIPARPRINGRDVHEEHTRLE